MALKTRIYQKENTARLGKMLLDIFKDFKGSTFLARQLTVRDIKAQYRQSYLGIFWAFVGPVSTALVWIFLNESGTVTISDTGIPYPVYAFSGTLIWSIVIEAINAPSTATRGARGIMNKINFPKEALILSGIYKVLFNSSFKVGILLVFVFAFGVGFHWSLLWLPLLILGAILLGTTFGLFITPISLLYNDVSQIISFGLRFLIYATPVVYAVPKDGILKTVMELNPLTPIILTTREAIVGFEYTYLTNYFVLMLLCIPLFLLGTVFYRISIPIIVERSN